MSIPFRLPGLGFYLCVLPSAALAGRLVWEQTLLSWERGPQMVGFSLVHSGLGLLLFAALAIAVVWAVAVLLMAVFGKGRRNATHLVGALVVFVAAGIVSVPYGRWVQWSAARIAHGPHAAEFLVYMAAIGDERAVGALLDRGVPVDAANAGGLRAIDAATNTKKVEMQDYLRSRGAAAPGP